MDGRYLYFKRRLHSKEAISHSKLMLCESEAKAAVRQLTAAKQLEPHLKTVEVT